MISAAPLSLPVLAAAPRARALTDGPRERALLEGVEALGDADLLAVLLGTGTARTPVTVLAVELNQVREGLGYSLVDRSFGITSRLITGWTNSAF